MNASPINTTFTVHPSAALEAHPRSARSREEEKLHTACVQLEAFIWHFAFKQTQDAEGHDGPFQDGPATSAFREMLDAERAGQVAKNSGAGLGEALYRQLSHRMEGSK